MTGWQDPKLVHASHHVKVWQPVRVSSYRIHTRISPTSTLLSQKLNTLHYTVMVYSIICNRSQSVSKDLLSGKTGPSGSPSSTGCQGWEGGKADQASHPRPGRPTQHSQTVDERGVQRKPAFPEAVSCSVCCMVVVFPSQCMCVCVCVFL